VILTAAVTPEIQAERYPDGVKAQPLPYIRIVPSP
jgi:hypothetical protein